MKRMFFLLGLLAGAAAVPELGFAKLLPLSIPPILAKKPDCSQYSGCPSGPCYLSCPDPCVKCDPNCVSYPGCIAGPCYPDCNDPCVSCNPTCQNYPGCPDGPCYPSCSDPCTSCSGGGLNDTGISIGGIYPSNNSNTCAGGTESSAQDCATGRDVSVPDSGDGRFGFSFVKNGTCIQDNVTGLTWSPDQGTATWDNLSSKVTTANNNQLCGMTGWRVPNVLELLSIVSYHQTNPAVDTAYFADTGSATYWTSIASASNSSNAWSVSFYYGLTATVAKTTQYSVRLVNGTQLSVNLVDKGDGTVVDKTSKKMWKKCLEGFTNASCTSSSASTFTWQGALLQPGAVNGGGGFAAGYTDWRLPNIKELQSIVDGSKSSPALDTTKFPNAPAGGTQVWSSSPYAVVGTYSKSWMVDFASGVVTTPLSRESSLYVRLVRDCTGTECD